MPLLLFVGESQWCFMWFWFRWNLLFWWS